MAKRTGVSLLTDLQVRRAKPGRHADGAGLHLVVSATGARSWVLRVQHRGTRTDYGLGAVSDTSLADARTKSAELRKVVRAGGDLYAARDKQEEVPPSFREAAEACHEARKAGWRDRHADAFLATLKLHVYPSMGRLRVDSVDANDVIVALKPLWTAKPAAARKIRQRIGTVLDFAAGRGWRRSGMPRDAVRPLLSTQAKPGNFAAMPYVQVPAFVSLLQERQATTGRLALLFTILTAARSGETRSAMWSHIDFEARCWMRPAGLMKGGKDHVVTLSPSAIAVLEQAKALRTTLTDSLVFPGSGGRVLSDMTLSKAMRAENVPVTVHGFRSSFRTWAAEQMPTIPEPVAEAALAHAVRDAVERAYQRANFIDMRRKLLDAWGNFCDGRNNVLQLVG